MSSIARPEIRPDAGPEPLDVPILVDGMTWREFKAAEQLLARPGVRLSFLNGVLEIRKMPGRKHETLKKRLAALVELYLMHLGVPFTPTGSMTLESEMGLVKREAGESYEIGLNRERPDLAIEVVISSGGIDKLAAYGQLKIPEVWFWNKGGLGVYELLNGKYEARDRSPLLPQLDLALLNDCMHVNSHVEALQMGSLSLSVEKN
ncbi:MAG: Uma2 family endonuclease [Synechococcales cyanobacterium RU_4_20]|nr:Uma2 family endonuclease [Synechococcales cyanobacterium RU_4_20]NJR70168.1 Uma2 family endonuclease [Synechococcales cyanobacterium CRU_2_2]